ncbi:g11141 [Coccomyxa elongata]
MEMKGGGWQNAVIGPVLQCLEAATLGMPFEVWKTHMGRNRGQTTLGSLRAIYREGGGGFRGVSAFWAGTGPKMFESATKGAILMYSKEAILKVLHTTDINPGLGGALAGAGGGLCQVSIMSPCTYLVTGAVTGNKDESTVQRIRRTYAAKGIKGFYPGGTAIAFRQMTNWASRQGFTEAVRNQFKKSFHGSADAKLTKSQEVGAGILGGTLACWNHPFEVARIEAQARGDQNQKDLNMVQIFRMIVKEQGPKGLFKGLVPRILLGIWQTLFMVTGAKLVQEALADYTANPVP